MRRIVDFWRSGSIAPLALAASALFGFLAFVGISSMQNIAAPVASMYVTPAEKSVSVDEQFTVDIFVKSSVPVNVFAGEVRFSKDLLAVESIDYNTSIADLWAELPWFSNGEGTLNFGGGSTRKGGFSGEGSLITVTFKTLGEGEGTISIYNPRILLHDGLGTDAEITYPVDAIFTIADADENLIERLPMPTTYRVRREAPSTDLNGDGKQSIADISIFMLKMAGNDSRYDFNTDGSVNLKDLNIILGAK